jgi:hypothetical protein
MVLVSGEISREIGEAREEEQVNKAVVEVEDQRDENRVAADAKLEVDLLSR